jgi:hypothetical protein
MPFYAICVSILKAPLNVEGKRKNPREERLHSLGTMRSLEFSVNLILPAAI